MLRLIALLSVVALCGCGNSNRVGSYHETTTTIGVSEPYTLPGAKTRCVGTSCGTPPKSSSAQRVDVRPLDSGTAAGEFVDPDAPVFPTIPSRPVEHTPATVVELPPEVPHAGSREAVVPVSVTPATTTPTTTTTTAGANGTTTTPTKRVIRWPRKLD